MFSDLALSRRLEKAEAYASIRFAEARHRLSPESRAEWMECAGTSAIFDGVDSPLTQSFGFGLYESPSEDQLDRIERFFFDRGAPALHEVSPHAGVGTLDLLCSRKYRPIEISNVLYQRVEEPADERDDGIHVRVAGSEESELFAGISARGWAHEHPEHFDFLLEFGAIATTREDALCFLAEVDGVPGAAGALSIHDGVALFAGSATVPEFRRRGLQSALLRERMRHAVDRGCDLAMMVAEAGSNSQRNAERRGFRIAYTRTKWRLARPQ